MRKTKKKEESKNLHLGFYFGFLVFVIIFISAIFKIFDVVKKSEFDGKNFFTVAVISGKEAHVISASPKESALKKLTIKGINKPKDLNDVGIPVDSLAQANETLAISPKSYFTKILLHKDGLKSSLTIIDLIRLAFFSQKTDGSKVNEIEVLYSNQTELNNLVNKWYMDPQIIEDNLNIEVTNTTQVSGLGNRIAKEITNMGGSVVLVNSSANKLEESRIYYKNDSYTSKKLSKLLDIPIEKKDISALSDIVVQIGEDKEEF